MNFYKFIDKEPVRIAGTKRKRESTPLLDELEDYEEEEVEEIHVEERETESPPPRVATALSVKREEEEGEREEERERPRERQREREGERRREREEGGSPTKVMKMADREGEESRSRSQRSSAIAKKIIKVLQVSFFIFLQWLVSPYVFLSLPTPHSPPPPKKNIHSLTPVGTRIFVN